MTGMFICRERRMIVLLVKVLSIELIIETIAEMGNNQSELILLTLESS
jgi:hypothetical protein